MRPPLDPDELTRLRLEAETREEQDALATQFAEWAADPHSDDPADADPAALLVEAGEMRELLGDYHTALELYRQAEAAEGRIEPDVRCFTHRALVRVGDLPTARRLAEDVRRSTSTTASACAMIGETYERAGDLVEAHRWTNLGIRRLGAQIEADDPRFGGFELPFLVIIRRRIRSALGLPSDGVDRLADQFTPPQ